MAPPLWQGISTSTPDRLVLDAGALYRNFTSVASPGDLVGATKGGAVFTADKEDRRIEVDGGARGPIKGLLRNIRYIARLEVTLLELSLQNFLDLTRGTAVSDGTHFTITPSVAIADADFVDFALIAEVKGTSDPIVLHLLDTLHVGEWALTTEDQNEAGLPVTFEAHYDPADLSAVPFRVLVPTIMS